MHDLWRLFWTFARIGSLTFGGGYAMLPMIQREIVEVKGWVSEDRVLEYYALGQCTPGIIAINTATFIGYDLRGVWGGIIATLGMVFPSLVIITLLAGVIDRFQQIQWLQHAFGGIRIAVVALIVSAVVGMWHQSVRNVTGIVLFASSFIAIGWLEISPIIVIVGGATIGLFPAIRTSRKRSDGNGNRFGERDTEHMDAEDNDPT